MRATASLFHRILFVLARFANKRKETGRAFIWRRRPATICKHPPCWFHICRFGLHKNTIFQTGPAAIWRLRTLPACIDSNCNCCVSLQITASAPHLVPRSSFLVAPLPRTDRLPPYSSLFPRSSVSVYPSTEIQRCLVSIGTNVCVECNRDIPQRLDLVLQRIRTTRGIPRLRVGFATVDRVALYSTR